MATSYRKNVDGQVNTTDATATTIVTYPIEDLMSVRVDFSTVAFSPDNGSQKCWDQSILAKRTGGSVALNGSPSSVTAPISDLGASSWSTQVVADTNNLYVQVVGQAATKINWFVSAWGICVATD